MLDVLCSEDELGEYAEVIAVGDAVRRLAARRRGAFFGTDLDAIEWRFNRYAEYFGEEPGDLSGTVTAIAALFVRLTRDDAHGWIPSPGSAWLEPLESTAATRRPIGPRRPEEGAEHLVGWRITLADAHVTACDLPQ